MEIIAETNDGFLITATKKEAKEIIRSVNGAVPENIKIGQKIPAIDYAATITNLKSLPDSYQYKQLMNYADQFNKELNNIKHVVENCSEI